jgi:hypothetical protein
MNAQSGMNWLRDKLNHPAHRGTLAMAYHLTHLMRGNLKQYEAENPCIRLNTIVKSVERTHQLLVEEKVTTTITTMLFF